MSKTTQEKEYEKSIERYNAQLDSYRALNESLMYQAAQNYDKYLITLSSGALALSLTFISTILKGKPLQNYWLLFTSWGCWLVTILSILYSFSTSSLSHSKAIDQVDDKTTNKEKPGGHLSTITQTLSRIGGISFFIAIISICFFVGTNMKGDWNMSDKKPINEGTTPRNPPTEYKGTVPKKAPQKPIKPVKPK